MIIGGVIGAIISIIATEIYNAFRKPYPVTRFDHLIRRRFKQRGIRGEDLEYSAQLNSTDVHNNKEFLQAVGCNDNGYCNGLTQLFNQISGIKLNTGHFVKTGFTISENVTFGKATGDLQFQLSANPPTPDFAQSGEDGFSVTVVLRVNSWNLKDIKDILHDSGTLFIEVARSINKIFEEKFESGKQTVSFAVRKEPVILQYLSKAGVKNVSSKMDDLSISISPKQCVFSGIKTSKDYDSIVDAIVWYV